MAEPFVISMKAVFDAAGVKAGTREAEQYVSELNRAATEEIRDIQRASADAARFTSSIRSGLGQALERRSTVQTRRDEMAALGQTIEAERKLETARLRYAHSDLGRAESIGRLAQLGRDAASATSALKTAELELAEANDRVGYAARRAASAIELQTDTERAAMVAAQARINASYGIGIAGRTRSEGAADIAAYGKELDTLRAKYNPVYAAIQRYRTELASVRQAHAVGAISTDEMTAAIKRERRATLASIAALKGRSSALGKAVGVAGYQMRNLQYQMIDFAQGIPLMFSSPTWALLNFANQGAQVAQIWGPEEGGAARGVKEAGLMVGRFVTKMAPVAGVIGISAAALAGFTHEIDKTTKKSVNMGDVILASLQVIGDGIYEAYFKPFAESAAAFWDMIWGGTIWVTKTLVNSVVVTVGTMSGSVEYAILGLWILLKGTAGTVQNFFVDSLQSVTDFITGGINSAIEKLNAFIRQIGADKAAGLFGLPDQFELVGKADFSNLRSGLADEAQAEFDALNKTYGDFFDRLTTEDHAGRFFTTVRDKVVENLSKPTEDEIEAAKKLAEAYEKIKLSVTRRVEAAKLEIQTLGMTEVEANKLRYAQQLLNQAYDAGIKLTAGQKAELRGLADAWAEQEDQLQRIKEIYDLGKSTTRSFFSDLKSSLMEGTNLWTAFGNAAANALNRIADKGLEQLADTTWNAIWSVINPYGSSGSLPINLVPSARGNVFADASGLDAYVNTIVTKPTIFPFARGGAFGLMGERDYEAVMPLAHTSDGSLGVRVANDNAANNNAPIVHLDMPIYNYSSATVRQTEEPDGKGGKRRALVIEDAVAGAVSRTGSSAARAIQGIGSVRAR